MVDVDERYVNPLRQEIYSAKSIAVNQGEAVRMSDSGVSANHWVVFPLDEDEEVVFDDTYQLHKAVFEVPVMGDVATHITLPNYPITMVQLRSKTINEETGEQEFGESNIVQSDGKNNTFILDLLLLDYALTWEISVWYDTTLNPTAQDPPSICICYLTLSLDIFVPFTSIQGRPNVSYAIQSRLWEIETEEDENDNDGPEA